jgi:hypothetical protein
MVGRGTGNSNPSFPLSLILVLLFIFISTLCIAHYPRVSYKRFTFTFTTLAKVRVTLESVQLNSGAYQSFPVFIESGFIFQPCFLHSYFTFVRPAFFHLSILILPLNSQLSSLSRLFKFWWWRKPECPEETTGFHIVPKSCRKYFFLIEWCL